MNTVSAAKSFKEYDKKFKGAKPPLTWGDLLSGLTDKIVRWKYAELIEHHSPVEIKYAVYDSDTAEDWQKYRVSMKGMTTKQKLLALQIRYSRMLEKEEMGYHLEAKLERTRIDNYIGALRRGGQLNSKYEVVK